MLGDEPSDDRQDVAEIPQIEPAQSWKARRPEFEDRELTSWYEHPAELAARLLGVEHIADPERDERAVEARIEKRKTLRVAREKRGVTVNEFLQSVSNPAVYAGGDAAASGPALTPKADHDASVLVTNLLEGNRRAVNYDGLASAVFTIPPLASAGLLESAARAAGVTFRSNWQDTSGWFNTRRVGETVSGYKVLIEEGTDRILGAHLLGPNAAEVINLFATAIRLRLPARELKEVIFAYPSSGSDTRFML